MTHMISRRRLLSAGATFGGGIAISAMLPRSARASTFAALGLPSSDSATLAPLNDDPRVKRIALAAVDAARSAGATYADVRLIREDRRTIYANVVSDQMRTQGISASATLTIGVRALVRGSWGYASSALWSDDEAARLGREAVHQANIASSGQRRTVELAPLSTIASGHWEMPVEIDPTTVAWGELWDFTLGTSVGLSSEMSFSLMKWERCFASTDGAYATQTTYRASANGTAVRSIPGGKVPPLTAAAAGWEYLRNYPFHAQREESSEWWARIPRLSEPVIGRFPAVIMPELVAGIASSTIGRASELDRMMGYRANTEGTSYLAEPLDILGRAPIASPGVTVTADRTMKGGCATVAWDDEGVASSAYPLITRGVLADCVTTRESASWLESYYRQKQQPVASRAGSSSRDIDPPETTTPNLTIAPSAERASVDDLCARFGETGYLVLPGQMQPFMDFQQLNGMNSCRLVEVRKGKYVGWSPGMFLFRAPELWSSVLACGDASTAVPVGVEYGNDPARMSLKLQFAHTVSAVPMQVKTMTFVRPIMRMSV